MSKAKKDFLEAVEKIEGSTNLNPTLPIPLPSGLTFEDKGYFRFYSDGKVGLVHPVLLRPSIGLVEVEGRMEKTRTWEFAGQIVPEGYGEDGL